jgi:hypothetical protein
MKLEFKHLTQVSLDDIIALNNHPKVLLQMPLGSPNGVRFLRFRLAASPCLPDREITIFPFFLVAVDGQRNLRGELCAGLGVGIGRADR